MINIIKGDITAQQTDIIVNAANCELYHGCGVCGAIYSAADSDLLRHCKENNLSYRPGSAKIMPGFKLRSKYLIQTVGPNCSISDQNADRSNILKSCYAKSMLLAKQQHAKSIAFPSISTGIFGYPIKEAAKICI